MKSKTNKNFEVLPAHITSTIKTGKFLVCAFFPVQQWPYDNIWDSVSKSNNFSGTRNSIRHLKIFRVISSETQILLLILCWCYFSCLKIYSEKFFNAFISKCFLKSLWQRETQISFCLFFFWEIIASTIKFSKASMFLGGHGFNILIHDSFKYSSEEWQKIYSAAIYFP